MAEATRATMGNGWRIAGWGVLFALLCLPAIAMRFTGEVDWTASDFVFAAVLLSALGIGAEIAVRVGRNAPHCAGIAIGALGSFLTVWINAAVGMLGSENEATNLAFIALVGIAVAASFTVWFRPGPMRLIAAALAVWQFGVGIAAGVWTMPGHAVEWGVLAFFAAIWSASAACFHVAWKRERT
ncbi:hypothetical protein [Qipengyuania spongiae]|uniref:DUF308 domain-containing protein n=1 Tax=Qipengyuania spongiae TaxID=2909673 RepID=A0ABY5SYX3_9SPHN|nr:hypothetical protein [Qipengyuania spongiae]UVI39380.1 hypothetical protein L1F33_14310 [Qipengyuania spongiae]